MNLFKQQPRKSVNQSYNIKQHIFFLYISVKKKLLNIIIQLKQMGEKKLWTEFEDNCLKYLKEQCGIQKWSQIAIKIVELFSINGRNQKQCRDRYLNNLNPNLTEQRWSQEDQDKLIQYHKKFGNRWTLIAQNFKGRTDSFIKNHFYSRLRKCIRKLNNQMQIQLKNNNNKTNKKFNLNIIFKLTNIVQGNFSKISPDVKKHYEELLYKLIRSSINFQNENQYNADNQQILSNILSLAALQNLTGLFEGNGKPKRGRASKKLDKFQITSSGQYLAISSLGILQIWDGDFNHGKNQNNFNSMEEQSESTQNEGQDFAQKRSQTLQNKELVIEELSYKKSQSQRKCSMQTNPDDFHFYREQPDKMQDSLSQMALQLGIQFEGYRKWQSCNSDLMQELLGENKSQDRHQLLQLLQMQ